MLYDQLATFPPYNVHFLHDIGSFSIGLGHAVVTIATIAAAFAEPRRA